MYYSNNKIKLIIIIIMRGINFIIVLIRQYDKS